MYKYLLSAMAIGMLFTSAVFAGESEGISNSIKWVTASELNNFGFDVMRGDSEEGTFVKINQHTIPGAGNSDTPNEYKFVDKTIEVGKVYWYYVESIAMSGQREKFTPTFQSKPRYPKTES